MTTNIRRRLLSAAATLAAGASLLPPRARAAVRPVRIGYALPQSGPFAVTARVAQEQPTKLWAEQVNAAGGLEVQGTRRPVQLLGYDDRGQRELTTQLYLRLMTADKVDLILAPWGTDATTAVASMANRYGYPLLAPTGLSRKLLDLNMPYFFSMLQEPDKMMTALVAVLLSLDIRTIGILYVDDLFGMEGLMGLQLALHRTPISVVARSAYAHRGIEDLSPLLSSLKEAGPQAFIGVTYPEEAILAAHQAREIDFDPQLFYTSVGACFPRFRDKLGAAAQGVLGMGSWNAKSGPGAKAFFSAYLARFGEEPDRWASGHSFAALQILEQSIAAVGLDRRRVREHLASTEFHTFIGPIKFSGSENIAMPGTVGQWQSGEFEIVWPADRATAPIIFPKAAWS
jgi:branched-chain amino acid transport system substrate-binding protein